MRLSAIGNIFLALILIAIYLGFYYFKDNMAKNATQPQFAGKTFTVIDQDYSKDTNYVYFHGIPILQSDPESFSIIPSSRIYYSKDKNRVYLEEYTIPFADPNSFEIVNDQWYWAKDKNHVFYKGRLLPEIDASSFETIDYTAKDKNNVYSSGNFLAGIDAASFTKLKESRFYRDKNYIYTSPGVNSILYDQDRLPINPDDFIYVEKYLERFKQEYSYYKTSSGICFDASNLEAFLCSGIEED